MASASQTLKQSNRKADSQLIFEHTDGRASSIRRRRHGVGNSQQRLLSRRRTAKPIPFATVRCKPSSQADVTRASSAIRFSACPEPLAASTCFPSRGMTIQSQDKQCRSRQSRVSHQTSCAQSTTLCRFDITRGLPELANRCWRWPHSQTLHRILTMP